MAKGPPDVKQFAIALVGMAIFMALWRVAAKRLFSAYLHFDEKYLRRRRLRRFLLQQGVPPDSPRIDRLIEWAMAKKSR
jgi:hypothetical protein